MPFTAGTRFGSFEVVGPLGKGGMGEVYRARDIGLGREVAIKVLPAELANDPGRLLRLEREAKVLASLNHPNIATLHGFERAGDAGFLVMELVEGETLADRIARGPMPWREALPIFEALAHGLKAAHDNGVVHRDLKPSNVKVDDLGRVKILDFGLARSGADEGSGPDGSGLDGSRPSPPITGQATVTGVVLGTAAYMSPEQARGQRVDRRADIWAFGCCLYEALTGARAFEGEDVSLVLAAVQSREPAWTQLPAGLPRRLDTLLRRCLEKEPRRRVQDLGDAGWLLAEARSADDTERESRARESPKRLTRHVALALAAAGLIVVGMLAGRFALPEPSAARHDSISSEVPLARFQVKPPLGRGTPAGPVGAAVAVHPQGTSFVFPAENALHVYDLGEGTSRLLAGRKLNGFRPFFSPDGNWVAFSLPGGEIVKIPSSGGQHQPVCRVAGLFAGATWRGDRIVFAVWEGAERGLWRVAASGGAPERLGSDPALGRGAHPAFLGERDAVLFTCRDAQDLNRERICVVDLTSGVVSDLGVEGRAPQYQSSGHLLWLRDSRLWGARMDPEAYRLAGEPRPLLGVSWTSRMVTPFATSSNGTLVIVEPDHYELVDFAADGTRRRLPVAGGMVHDPNISPDGRLVAYVRGGMDSEQIWIHELATGREHRVTDARPSRGPRWTAQGDLVYLDESSGRSAIRIAVADGSRPPSTLWEGEEQVFPTSVSLDGTVLLDAIGRGEALRLTMGPPVGIEPWTDVTPVWTALSSPNGRWVAYKGAENKVWVRPYAGPGSVRPASLDRGFTWDPRWAKDGRELFFETPSDEWPGWKLEAIEFREVGADFVLGDTRVVGSFDVLGYDPKPDGKGFILAERRKEPPTFTVVVNLARWLSVDSH